MADPVTTAPHGAGYGTAFVKAPQRDPFPGPSRIAARRGGKPRCQIVAAVYCDLPWRHIRFEWENTSTSLAALARKYRIRSVTTLERRRAAEQWSRAAGVSRRRSAGAAMRDPGQTQNDPPPTIAYARELQTTGQILLDHLRALLQPADDPKGEARMREHLERLMKINPERNSFSELLMIACLTIEKGVNMERTLLGLSVEDPSAHVC